ncbi:MAG: hypothetical protein M1816_004762 [Peltula sp. TS41687]|nr:MAG: hypothetical protein M1816_004762 [Peltula sp. TS41687]
MAERIDYLILIQELLIVIPDEICGDLDSIRADVRDEYAKLGVTITRLASQSETDFGKCVSRIGMYYDSQQQQQRCSTTTNHEGSHRGSADEPFDILVLGGLGGRIDQAFSILHRLYNPPERPTWIHGRIFLFSEENVSWVLNPGRNVVVVARRRRRAYLGVNVGIIPIGCPAVISTKGLEWDVAGWRTEFGEQVSTSNHLMAGEEGGDGDDDVLVEIVTDKCVLFTVERAPMMPGCECCLSEVVV